MLGESPFWVCNSRVRFGNNRDPDSCSGEPAPTLTLFMPARPLVRFGSPNGDFDEALVGISETGDIPERLRLSLPSGLEPGAMSRLWNSYFRRTSMVGLCSRCHAGELG